MAGEEDSAVGKVLIINGPFVEQDLSRLLESQVVDHRCCPHFPPVHTLHGLVLKSEFPGDTPQATLPANLPDPPTEPRTCTACPPPCLAFSVALLHRIHNSKVLLAAPGWHGAL